MLLQSPRRKHGGVVAANRALTLRSVQTMKVILRNPSREITVDGRRRVHALLAELQMSRESHLVIRNGTLVPGDAELSADDVIEIRPVISGGA